MFLKVTKLYNTRLKEMLLTYSENVKLIVVKRYYNTFGIMYYCNSYITIIIIIFDKKLKININVN